MAYLDLALAWAQEEEERQVNLVSVRPRGSVSYSTAGFGDSTFSSLILQCLQTAMVARALPHPLLCVSAAGQADLN